MQWKYERCTVEKARDTERGESERERGRDKCPTLFVIKFLQKAFSFR